MTYNPYPGDPWVDEPTTTTEPDATPMQVEDFPVSYRAAMVHAYPVIAQMSRTESYYAGPELMDEAFSRVLANSNLERTHRMFLADLAARRTA